MDELSDLASLADLNLAAQLKLRAQGAPNAKLLERNGLIGYSIGQPAMDGYLNGMLPFGSELPVQEVLNAADDFLQLLGHGFVMWIRDHANRDLELVLKQKGLAPVEEPGGPAMVILSRVSVPTAAADIDVRQVASDKDVLDFALVNAAAFDRTIEVSRLAFGSLSGLAGRNVIAFIASSQRKPLAAAMIMVEQGLGGVYHVGTVPEARRAGLGALCTALATNAGFDLGAKATILQASPEGERVYARLGYKTYCRYRWYHITSRLTA
jgi:hypothetical protein